VAKPGVYLLPAGSTIRDVIDAAGGMAEGHALKAYQPGGPSSGLLPARSTTCRWISTRCNRMAVHRLGRRRGAVGQGLARDAALNMLRFFEDESCGQCTPCRSGCEKAVKLMQAESWDRELAGRALPDHGRRLDLRAGPGRAEPDPADHEAFPGGGRRRRAGAAPRTRPVHAAMTPTRA
jgi:hypothetical protein